MSFMIENILSCSYPNNKRKLNSKENNNHAKRQCFTEIQSTMRLPFQEISTNYNQVLLYNSLVSLINLNKSPNNNFDAFNINSSGYSPSFSSSTSLLLSPTISMNKKLNDTKEKCVQESFVKKRIKKEWCCEYCQKVFDRPSLLQRHIRTHTGEKPHSCEFCGKAFSTTSSLNTHMRIHSGEKPHECNICGKKFTASSNLYYHKLTHTKDKPHKCLKCFKSFSTPGDLRVHMHTHDGTWPFKCNICLKGFTKQANFKNHLLTHTEEKSFSLECNLKSHSKAQKQLCD